MFTFEQQLQAAVTAFAAGQLNDAYNSLSIACFLHAKTEDQGWWADACRRVVARQMKAEGMHVAESNL